MKIAFMSSVCPAMTLAELIAAGQKHGYEGIEFRPEWDQKHGVELELSAADRKEVAKMLADGGLEGCCLSPRCPIPFKCPSACLFSPRRR